MLKRLISYPLIFSILWPNILQAMDANDEEGRKSPPIVSSPPSDRELDNITPSSPPPPLVENRESGSGNNSPVSLSPEKLSPRDEEDVQVEQLRREEEEAKRKRLEEEEHQKREEARRERVEKERLRREEEMLQEQLRQEEEEEKARRSKERKASLQFPLNYEDAKSIFILKDPRDSRDIGTHDRDEDRVVEEVGSFQLEGHGSLGSFALVPVRTEARGSIQEGRRYTDKPSLLDDEEGNLQQPLLLVVSHSGEFPPPSDPRFVDLPLDPLNDIDARVIAFLKYSEKFIKRGRITWKQGLIGGIGGGFIGAIVGKAMIPVLNVGLRGVGGQFRYELVLNNTVNDIFDTHTAITLGIDSISRNAMILGEFTEPSIDKFSVRGNRTFTAKILDYRNGINVLIFIGAGFAALLPVYYLWSAEEWNISHNDPYSSVRKESMILLIYGAPALFLDSLFMNARSAKSWIDEKIDDLCVKAAYDEFQMKVRKKTLSELNQLERFFRRVSNEDIDEIYEQVLKQGLGIDRNGIDMPDILEAAEGLRVLKVLSKIKNDFVLPPDFEDEQDVRRWIANVVGLGIPVAATVGRSFVFYTIIFHMLGDLGLGSTFWKDLLAIPLGGGVASVFQGKVEVDATQQGAYELMFGENTDCDASHNIVRSGARKVGKGYTYLQGAWNTLPYLLVGLVATQGWPLALQICTLLFFGLADTFNNAMSFNESYGGVIQGAESLGSYAYATTTYKRNKLLRMVRAYKKTYGTMDPKVLVRVTQLIHSEVGEEAIHDSVLRLLPQLNLQSDTDEGHSE